jgi:hypothetical protein
LPVKKIDNNIQLFIRCLVEIIIFIRKKGDTQVFKYIEQVLNSAVYELYFPDEIHAADKGIIEHLQDLKPIDDSMSDEEKLAVINSEFERLYDPYHPVRNNVETLDNVEVVRIIKEALRK